MHSKVSLQIEMIKLLSNTIFFNLIEHHAKRLWKVGWIGLECYLTLNISRNFCILMLIFDSLRLLTVIFFELFGNEQKVVPCRKRSVV